MVNLVWENLFKNKGKERTVIQILKDNILFQDLSLYELGLLEKIIHIRSFRQGEVIFRQGEAGVGMFIISKGEVGIYVEEIEPKSGETATTHVTQLKAGDFFGDLALVEPEGRRTATAISSSESILIGFFKPDLLELADRNPTAGVKILLRLGEVLGYRLKETTTKLNDLKRGQK